jgi:N-acetylneuraminate epimerase
MSRLGWILCCVVVSACDMRETNLEIDWTIAGKLPVGVDNQEHIGVAGPVTGIIGDVLVVAGGANFPNGMPWDGGQKAYSKDVYLFTQDRNNGFTVSNTQSFGDSVAYAANISIENSIYSVGGERNGTATADVFRYFLENDSFQRVQLPSLPKQLTNGGVTRVNDYIYFVGGENADLVSDKVYRLKFEEANSNWEVFAELAKPLTHAVITSDEKENIYIIGGRKRNTNAKSDMYDEVFELNLSSKKITLLDRLPEALAAGTGGYYNGNLIVIGGDNAHTFHQVEELIGAINLESDDNKKTELIVKKNNMQCSHPGFSTNVWTYNLADKTWKSSNKLQGESPVTTTVIIKNGNIIIPSGEVRAGVRTNQILVGKIK